ncbi:H(+)/Cl(-) exchange transporter ClcA [Dickeya lacustris]|uniref:H(+)/Cl(-) exchange transporter ClcA n=1 Tax=Dickeya lacustris TaxID=2259638 RepID=A0ABY8GAL7_9GAMM|nr:H(+)/Cl(-) exchange transporter ClcA [Dickeya lacustris]WFN56953.1 H(+)/Cl(-) exchange transporter ClcA [Dickeya lacustris]
MSALSAFFSSVVGRHHAAMVILVMAALVGTVVGFLGVGFNLAVNSVLHVRLALLSAPEASPWRWPLGVLVSAVLAMSGYWLVRRIAPEAGGSGIPEIEGALAGVRPVRWWRVLPVKFFGGMGTLGAGMVLGREGPTVQLGGNVGGMLASLLPGQQPDARHTLLATGAAAGLAAAFNAPLAGILFIIEEMRAQFRYNPVSIKAVFVGVIMASMVYRLLEGDQAVIAVGHLAPVSLRSLWLYVLLGCVAGAVGTLLNALVLWAQALFLRFHAHSMPRFLLTGLVAGGVSGLLTLVFPAATGGGFTLISTAATAHISISGLLAIFLARVAMTLLCFCSGAPGGIFAPMLSLGALLGAAFGASCTLLLPAASLVVGTCAVVGMGALFAACVRAPLTGIVLVLEMTDNYSVLFPMIIACFAATLVAQLLGGQPLYSAILARTLARQSAETPPCVAVVGIKS